MRALEQLWWRQDEPAAAELLLWPLTLASLAFRAGSEQRKKSIDPQRAKAKVISVGNLAVGGAGKTPVAMKLCELLRARGHKPALLSRGHGRTSREETVLVCDGQGPLVPASDSGDEPLLIARRLPWLTVLVGPDRAQLAEAAESRGADVLILDDGLQHLQLARDLDVVVIDAQNPLGNGRILPRGPLREGLEAFDRVGARGLLWLSNAGDPSKRSARLGPVLQRAKAAGLAGPIESRVVAHLAPGLCSLPSFLLAGIARPERFEDTARGLGLDVRGRAFFADHHRFSAAELAQVRKLAQQAGAQQIVTTEKDAARIGREELGGGIPGIPGMPILPLPIELEILRGAELLGRALEDALGPPPSEASAAP